MSGRVEMDVIRILRREIKMNRYSLNEASKVILGKLYYFVILVYAHHLVRENQG